MNDDPMGWDAQRRYGYTNPTLLPAPGRSGAATESTGPTGPSVLSGPLAPGALFVSIIAVGVAVQADSIRLNDRIGAPGPDITLGEVAELEGARAQSFARMVVASLHKDQKELTIRLDEVRRTLTAGGANWARLKLRGYASCRVDRVPIEPSPFVDNDAPIVARAPRDIAAHAALTLKALAKRKLQQFARVDPEDLRITFSDLDEGRLRRSRGPGRIEIDPRSASSIGRIPVTIRRYKSGRVVESFPVTADVARRVTALVDRRMVRRGAPITADGVELREVFITRDRGDPLTDPEVVIGQWASPLLRSGAMIYPEHIRSPVLVKRGQWVMVRRIGGGLIVRTIAKARQNGSLDDRILVRNETSNEDYYVTVTGLRQGVILADGERRSVARSAGGAGR